jgi:hypothetical protein
MGVFVVPVIVIGMLSATVTGFLSVFGLSVFGVVMINSRRFGGRRGRHGWAAPRRADAHHGSQCQHRGHGQSAAEPKTTRVLATG